MQKAIRAFGISMVLLSLIALFACSASKSPRISSSAISVGGGTLCTDIPKFALCTSAPCRVSPDDPDMSICDCVVEEGPNWGKSTCEDRMPQGLGLTSNFTPLQAGPPMNLKALVCENDPVWAVCIDAPCKIDPDDPAKVTCRCPIAKSTPWLTFGGGCDQDACKELWSAGQTMDAALAQILEEFRRLGVPGWEYPQCGD